MNNQTHKIHQFLELDDLGQAKYSVIDVQSTGQNRVLFTQSAKVFAQFNDQKINLSEQELRTLTHFLLTSMKKFITIFPVYKTELKKINLLIPNEVISYESAVATFNLPTNETEQLKLTTAIIQAKWSEFVTAHQQEINQTGEEMAIDCSCVAMKVNDVWIKTPVVEQALISNEISFASEWQRVKTAQLEPLLNAINQAELVISKVNGLSKIICNPQLNNWLYTRPSLVVEWGRESTWVKYYDGKGNLTHEKMQLGVKDLYERALAALNLNVDRDFQRFANLVENYVDLNSIHHRFKDFCVLRTRNNQAVITTYTMNQVLKTLVHVLDEMLVTIKETIAFKLGVNTNALDYQIHCGLIAQLPGIGAYFGTKQIKFLQPEVTAMVQGNYSQAFEHLIEWAKIFQMQETTRAQGAILGQTTKVGELGTFPPDPKTTIVPYQVPTNVLSKELEK